MAMLCSDFGVVLLSGCAPEVVEGVEAVDVVVVGAVRFDAFLVFVMRRGCDSASSAKYESANNESAN